VSDHNHSKKTVEKELGFIIKKSVNRNV